jgi:tetratricopeptide (TPR) repeat protein
VKRLLPIVFAFLFLPGIAQNRADSLWNSWQNTQLADTVRLASLKELILDYYLNYDSDSTILLAQMEYEFASKSGQKKYKAQALLTQGKAYYYKGENLKALDAETKSLIISQGTGDKKAMGNTLCNLGNVFLEMGNYSDAVDKYTQSMKIAEELDDKALVAANLANIGIICFSQGDYKKAMEYNSKNLEITEELNDPYSLSYSYRNIGKVHEVKGDFQKAIFAYTRAYNFSEEAKDESGMSYSLSYLGNVYRSMKDYDKAEEYFQRSLAIGEKLNDTYGISENLNAIGNCYLEKKNYPKAIEYCKKSLALAEKTELVLIRRNATQSLYSIYKRTGDYKQALAMHELFTNVKDTLLSEENRKGVLKKEIQYKYEKQSLADSLAYVQKQELNEVAHASQLEKEKHQRYILYGGLLFALSIGAVAFRGYRRKKRDNETISFQKKQVELQKDIVEQKQKEIIDSISYAKRIQDTILPPPRIVKQWFPDSFIYYKPKDIVAGDFYWLEAVHENNSGQTVFLAAADCTGHGVPGALVSVVCSNALNRSVKEFGLRQPGPILGKARDLVIESFNKEGEDVKDGMDISLISIQQHTSGITEAEWAGANNPLWIIRNGELIEFKADKQPIGQYTDAHPFTTHKITLQKGDTLYLFSDGFQDQFGQASGKKFKSAQMKKLFLSVQDRNMDEQKKIIDQTFREWKGSFEQVDDVCIIGLRI